jgi:hypothetical protein
MSFKLTSGNVDDRTVVLKMCQNLDGWLFGDRGYVSRKLTKILQDKGVELMTKAKKNMKKQVLTQTQKQWLNKQGVRESAIDQLKSLLYIQHTRHRSPDNFLTNFSWHCGLYF